MPNRVTLSGAKRRRQETTTGDLASRLPGWWLTQRACDMERNHEASSLVRFFSFALPLCSLCLLFSSSSSPRFFNPLHVLRSLPPPRTPPRRRSLVYVCHAPDVVSVAIAVLFSSGGTPRLLGKERDHVGLRNPCWQNGSSPQILTSRL